MRQSERRALERHFERVLADGEYHAITELVPADQHTGTVVRALRRWTGMNRDRITLTQSSDVLGARLGGDRRWWADPITKDRQWLENGLWLPRDGYYAKAWRLDTSRPAPDPEPRVGTLHEYFRGIAIGSRMWPFGTPAQVEEAERIVRAALVPCLAERVLKALRSGYAMRGREREAEHMVQGCLLGLYSGHVVEMVGVCPYDEPDPGAKCLDQDCRVCYPQEEAESPAQPD